MIRYNQSANMWEAIKDGQFIGIYSQEKDAINALKKAKKR